MDPFKQTDIGLIPEDWGLNKLSETSEIIMGQSPPSSTYNSNGNGLPFYQGKTDFGSIYPKPRIWCTSPSKIAEKNDILISVRAPVGPTNLSFEKSGIGRGLSAIRVKQNDYLYLYYYLKKIENEIEKLGTGSTFKAINKSQLHNIKIPLPPLSEQKKIAYVLSKIQQAIEKQEQIIKTTQELKKALMQKLFTEGLYGEPQKHTEIGPIPESWEVVPF
ncbi:MAG TPA: restriction endonuclease subunit S, partial [Ignavibacteriaceae bacterium]|nr:restriction endonuclease subunit S [Ignavibacteriaceae bacterium]